MWALLMIVIVGFNIGTAVHPATLWDGVYCSTGQLISLWLISPALHSRQPCLLGNSAAEPAGMTDKASGCPMQMPKEADKKAIRLPSETVSSVHTGKDCAWEPDLAHSFSLGTSGLWHCCYVRIWEECLHSHRYLLILNLGGFLFL